MAASTRIHPLALVEDGAAIGENTVIGPFCHIGPNARIGANCKLMSHVVVDGMTTLGDNATVFHHAVLGAAPQNNKHKGGPTTLVIGKNCLIREGVTMHPGSDTSTGTTIVGDDCTFLAYAHVAHDCVLGNKVTFANNVMIGGHVTIGDSVIIGGGGGVHQHCRVGHHAFVGGMAALVTDLIPYGTAIGVHAHLGGLNIIGMKRSGVPRVDIHAMRHAVKMLFDRAHTVRENAVRVEEAYGAVPIVKDLLSFMDFTTNRKFCVPLSTSSGEVSGDGDE
ncbi:MAG: acyl-ACP--UDP-N-acetylglucosamine O-acyltransferase [Rhizobiaceae bacterium]